MAWTLVNISRLPMVIEIADAGGHVVLVYARQ
jgi:hypothetical protein